MPFELLAALADKCYYLAMELSARERVELRALANGSDVSARIATRARIVLWSAEGRMKKDIAMLAGVSRPTVDFWIDRYGFGGVAALHDRPSGAPREQIPPTVGDMQGERFDPLLPIPGIGRIECFEQQRQLGGV